MYLVFFTLPIHVGGKFFFRQAIYERERMHYHIRAYHSFIQGLGICGVYVNSSILGERVLAQLRLKRSPLQDRGLIHFNLISLKTNSRVSNLISGIHCQKYLLTS